MEPELSFVLWVGLGILGLIIFLWFFPVTLWFQALISGVRISLIQLVLMRWRGVSPNIIVMAMVTGTKAGLKLYANELEAHYLAKGNVPKVVNALISADKAVKNAKVAILGFTFKENCPDTRNTRIIDIVNELKEYGIDPIIADPDADAEEALHHYGIEFVDAATIKDMDAVILAVAHDSFSSLTMADMDKFFGEGKKVLLDIKGLLNRKEYEDAGYSYWRL